MAKSTESNGQDPSGDPSLPHKKRARRRLVGAAAIGLAAAIVLPMVLDSEPRKQPSEVNVQIPSRETPLKSSAPKPGPAVESSTATGSPPAGAPAAVQAPASSPASDPAAGKKAEKAEKAEKTEKAEKAEKAESKPDPAADRKAAEKMAAEKRAAEKKAAESKAAEAKAAKAAAAESKANDSKAADGKAADVRKPSEKGKAGTEKAYLLQAGAFSTEKGATDQVARVKEAGLRAYIEKVKTADGERVRVRVGPFPNREAAEQARGQLKLSGIDSAVIVP